jgi:hypothetical protein
MPDANDRFRGIAVPALPLKNAREKVDSQEKKGGHGGEGDARGGRSYLTGTDISAVRPAGATTVVEESSVARPAAKPPAPPSKAAITTTSVARRVTPLAPRRSGESPDLHRRRRYHPPGSLCQWGTASTGRALSRAWDLTDPKPKLAEKAEDWYDLAARIRPRVRGSVRGEGL